MLTIYTAFKGQVKVRPLVLQNGNEQKSYLLNSEKVSNYLSHLAKK